MNMVFFDLETQRTFDEVGGRHNIRKLGLSVAVTYSTADGRSTTTPRRPSPI